MKIVSRPVCAAVLIVFMPVLGTACSSEPEGPSLSADKALAECHDVVEEEYIEQQRPLEFDSENTAQEDGAWKISGIVRGTKPAEVDSDGKPVGDERVSEGMAKMRFACTVTDEVASLDTLEFG